ncbi:carboxylesterase [Psychrobacillus sp. OK032]|uniref:alpha/beta hydrolase n=1 Tax=Psychrobacillus sp. OK032 TaxID=1884358 RepID=UPI0008B72E26|nr:alpha/beta hydrolase [Psychrobacillus sp. OK032]SES43916.1 carboxylesterase [Psychrobacillus sp. OK032]
MIIRPAKELFLEGNETAILLLHSYTSHTRDMKKLAEYLNQHIGCTCYVPLYKGHGIKPEALLNTTINDWWKNIQEAYYFLQQRGYKKISLIGLSVGGIFSLKLAQEEQIERLIVMSVPKDRTPERLKQRLIDYAKAYKQLEGKTSEMIAKELLPFQEMPLHSFKTFQEFIHHTMDNVSHITAPVEIYYGNKDDSLYEKSAGFVFENVSSNDKKIKAFPNSTHLMTLGKDKESLFEEVMSFIK